MSGRDILIIGGTGVFGKRLVQHLSKERGLKLHVSSRNADKAAAFIETLDTTLATLYPVTLDCQKNLKERLAEISPYIVVDCSGPFQGARYDTARQVLAAKSHYLDLADARDYLAGFKKSLDETARYNKVSAWTGASSTPTLSTCVATHLTTHWQRVDTVDICIVPGGKSEVGRSVIDAIMSYAGKDVPIWSGGKLTHAVGWSYANRINIPGLGSRRVATVETYDPEYLGPQLDVQSRVSFSAGLESWIEQYGMEAIAKLRAAGILPSPKSLVPALLSARKITRIPTSSSGGMQVRASGIGPTGVQTQSEWNLIARQDHGPYIPILPAAALIRRLLSGATPYGADYAHRAVSLSEILHEMHPYDISAGASTTLNDPGIFERALGAKAFETLPKQLSNFHGSNGPVLWSGRADVDRGTGILAKTIGKIFGFPNAGQEIAVTVAIDRFCQADGTLVETWTRSFAGRHMSSNLKAFNEKKITEQFWPFTFILHLDVNAGKIEMPVTGWKIGKLALPTWLAPKSQTSEFVDENGRFRFDVKLTMPLIGMLAHYRGWLAPDK
ncbi:MAG: DUF4166 domain-containing protein [Roseobacter sp.]